MLTYLVIRVPMAADIKYDQQQQPTPASSSLRSDKKVWKWWLHLVTNGEVLIRSPVYKIWSVSLGTRIHVSMKDMLLDACSVQDKAAPNKIE